MGEVSSLIAQIVPEGVWGKVAFIAACWYAAACFGHFVTALLMLQRFSREGPVIPQLLPALEEKWKAAHYRIELWLWLRAAGMSVLVLAIVLALASAGLGAYTILSAPRVAPDWRTELTFHVRPFIGILGLLGITIAVRTLVGGPGSLLLTRARNYVSASTALVSSEDLARAKRFLDDVERMDTGESDSEHP
jgi:hypothetical protein